MTFWEQAAAADAASNLHMASCLYVEALRAEEPMPLDAYLQGANIFFLTQDYGDSSAKSFSSFVVENGWKLCNECLNKAVIHFGWSARVEFWKRYYSYIALGESDFFERALTLFHEFRCRDALVYLHSYDSSRFYSDACQFADSIFPPTSELQRYMLSLLPMPVGKTW